MRKWEQLVEEGAVCVNVPLGPLTTYKLGGPARYLATPDSRDELVELSSAWGGRGEVLVLGRGSNLIVADGGFDGLVIRLGPGFDGIDMDEDGSVTAGGGVSLPLLARSVVAEARRGLEFFVGVPGTVGGAVRMNAGCHGTDTSEHLISAEVFDLESGSHSVRTTAELELSYRHSALTDAQVVCFARFRTTPGSVEGGRAVMREISSWRKEHQPGGTYNAGSIFKNPPGDHAGRIIDALSLKGTRVGGASVSSRHANFFVTEAGATAQDVFDLVGVVKDRVLDATGTELIPEIRFVGDFAGRQA